MKEKLYISVDTETGGLDPSCSLLSVGICVGTRDQILCGEEWLVRPDDGIYHVDPESLQINKIDLAEHRKLAIPYREAKTAIYDYLRQIQTQSSEALLSVVGKNVAFDLRAIWEHLIRRSSWEGLCSYRLIEITGIAEYMMLRGTLPQCSNSLTSIAEVLGIEVDPYSLHNAYYDARLTLRVWQELLKR